LTLIPKLTTLRQPDTVRLIPTRFVEKEDSVLAAIATKGAVLDDLFDLDNALNKRLRAGVGLLPGIGVDELVYGVPHFRNINAAFTYAHPNGSRFNDNQRGAWYCAFEPETALAEVIFHKTTEYAEINHFHDSLSYQTLLADFSGDFHDLRGTRGFARCLAPDSYVESQALAAQLLEAGSMGIIYPSVRRKGGTNLACFRPALVGNVRKGLVYRLTWEGSPAPKIEAAP
jgi:RES domain-containing protein